MRLATVLLQFVILVGIAVGGYASRKPSPDWPQQFQISWELTVPYIDKYQDGHFKYVYNVWQDTATARQKIVRDEVEEVLILVPTNQMYQIFPAYDKRTCWLGEVHGGTGPTLVVEQQQEQHPLQQRGDGVLSASVSGDASLFETNPRQHDRKLMEEEQQKEDGERNGPFKFDFEKDPASFLTFVLPDLSEPRWQYLGKRNCHHNKKEVEADVWEWDMSEGNMTMSYRFYVTEDGVPLKLWMMGINLLSGGHKDEYVMNYFDYKVGPLPEDIFSPPQDVECGDPQPDVLFSRNTLVDSIRRHLPNTHHGDEHYDRFAHRHGRRHRSAVEYEARRQVFHDNRAFIEGWNSMPGPRHRVAMNHFGDWTQEEFASIVMPSQYRSPDRPPMREHQVSAPFYMLPKELIWRGTRADSPVKDQAACGSCWSFSTVAAFETAYFRATGRQQLFSEQQLIDCAWEVNNHGCYGGDQGRAFNWVLSHGGLARNEDYPYRGINDFCKTDVDEIKFKGETVMVKGGELAVMDALMTKGPMTVSVDASAPSFKFYAGGVFHLPECATDPRELDHAVILSGYGTTEDGVDYWLVKNIWSPFWGEDGYIRITRKPNDCGIASEPIYVDMTLL